MGGWNDSSGAATEARIVFAESLGDFHSERKIRAHRLVRVSARVGPVNWGIFRILGRVEWAWVAAPIIAIVGALVVVRWPSWTLALLEVERKSPFWKGRGATPRAHLTRYIALYTSFASTYEVQFDDANAFIQPFPGQSK